MTESNTFSIACDRCSRTTHAEIMRCPNLPSDMCVFRLTQGRGDGWNELWTFTGTPSVLKWLGGLIVLFLMVAFCSNAISTEITGVFFPIIFVTSLGSALLGSLIRRKTLWNQATGSMWQRISVLGIPLRTTSFTTTSRLTLEPPASGLPDLPFSIASLAADLSGSVAAASRLEDAITLMQFALAGLLCRGNLRAAHGTFCSLTFLGLGENRKADSYLLFPAGRALDGKVEKTLYSAVQKSDRPLTVYQATRALYASDKDDPVIWLIDSALSDAAAHGVFRELYKTKTSLLWGKQKTKHYRVDQAHLDGFMRDKQLANDACAAIYKRNSGLQNEMREQIKAAISSRVDTRDSGY